MILEKETYEKFGYYPSDLKPKSSKKILATCDDCSKIREIQKCTYHPLCHPCSLKKGASQKVDKYHCRGSKYPLLNDKKWLYQIYQIEDLSEREIAKIIGCPISTLRKRMNKQDIHIQKRERTKRKYRILDNKEWLHQKYWGEMLNTSDIAIIIGCHRHSVWRALKKNGIKMRTAAESKTKLTFLQCSLNNTMRRNIRRALKGKKNGRHWETLVGYTLAELMQTLEKEFRGGMSWKNYGTWHIDHIIPLVRFTYEFPDDPEFKKAWRLKNLQPLWADENLRKGQKFMFF